MKRSIIATAALLSLSISASAMAKDIDTVDLFVGDFAGVVSLDFDTLVANKMIDGAISQSKGAVDDADKILAELKELGIDYKKDIDTVAVAINDKGHVCAAVDAKKSVKDAFDKGVKKDKMTAADHNGMNIYSDASNAVVLLSDTRILACEKDIDIKPLIDNAKAAKPKLLKEHNPDMAKAFAMTDNKADIRIAGKMTPTIKGYVQSYKLDDGKGKSIAVADADMAAISVSFKKGLDVSVIAAMKADAKAKDGAAVINGQLSGILSDPSLAELGLGFVKDAVKVSADKKNLKASLKLNDEQLSTISMLVAELTGAAAPAKAAPAKAPKK